MTVHKLKTLPVYFNAVLDGRKNFEMRLNDRAFAVGDVLVLREHNLSTGYTGRELQRKVTYILSDMGGLDPDFVVLAMVPA